MRRQAQRKAEREQQDALLVLALAVAIDLLLGEPAARLHPVVWLGALIDRLERSAPDRERRTALIYGAISTLAVLCLTTGSALAAAYAIDRLPRALRILTLAVTLKPAFALRALLTAAGSVRQALDAHDLDRARESLRSLVSRDVAGLPAEECAAAAIESLAENTTDAFIGPWLGWLLLGLPGAWLFRAVNTLDSRWGYHGRYELLGRTAARLDDACAALPSRLSAILLIAAAAAGGASPTGAARTIRRDHARTASPNAGWTMAAMAGALELRLAKPGAYVLNVDGAAAGPDDVGRAQRLTLLTAAFGLAAAGLFTLLCHRRPRLRLGPRT